MIETDDRGLLLGDGLFETVLWEAGTLQRFDRHADRLRRSCAVLGLPPPGEADLESAARAAVAPAALDQARAAVRLTWTAGGGGRGLDRPETLRPRLFAHAAPAPASERPIRLATASIRRNEASPTSRLKTLAYLDNVLARREARAAGADEALMLNGAGEIACAAAANLFWFEGNALVTPALACGVLAGITREAVIARAAALGLAVREVRERPTGRWSPAGFFLTNSLIGARAVAAMDGRPVADHPLRKLLDVV